MKNTPCLKYQHEKHTLYKKLAFGSFWEEDIQLLRRIQILYQVHCMQNCVQQSLRKQPPYQMISKGSHLVVIIRIVNTGLHDCNITDSSIRLTMNRKNC